MWSSFQHILDDSNGVPISKSASLQSQPKGLAPSFSTQNGAEQSIKFEEAR
jgi:hypothetical protein